MLYLALSDVTSSFRCDPVILSDSRDILTEEVWAGVNFLEGNSLVVKSPSEDFFSSFLLM